MRASPQGRQCATRVIRRQRSFRPSIRLGLRPIQTAELEACRKRNAFHAPCAPPTVFLPSLRAHKPNPAGLRSVWIQAGEFLQKIVRPGCRFISAMLEVNTEPALGIVTRGRSINKPAHPHIHCGTKRQKHKHHRRSPITHQGQRDSGNRHKTDDHTHVDQDLEGQHSHDTHNKQGT